MRGEPVGRVERVDPIKKRRKPLKDVDAFSRAQLLKAFAFLAPVSLLFAALATLGALSSGLGLFPALLVGIGLGLGVPFLCFGAWYRLVIGGTASFLGRLFVGGSSGMPPHPAYWRAESLSARGAYTDALAAFESLAAEDPGDPGPCLRAATLCAEELGDSAAAARWYLRARSADRVTPETHAYISVRLADIYESRGELRRAAAELRRVFDRHPGSRYARRAAAGLADLAARGVDVHEVEEKD